MACFACLLLPWLNPFASGPSSGAQPWLFTLVCASLALALAPAIRLPQSLYIGSAAVAALAIARGALLSDTLALMGSALMVFMAAAVAAAALRKPELLRAVALAWLIAALASTAIGVVQYFGVSQGFAPWISVTGAGEAFGNLRQRNQFASLAAIGMASLFWLSPGTLRRGIALAAIVWLAVGSASTTSRTGLVQMLMLGVLALLLPGPRLPRAGLWLAGMLAYVAAALALPLILDATTGVTSARLWERIAAADECSARTVLWSNVLELIGQRPWLGWGWGELDYAHYAHVYAGPRFCDILDNAHNLPLHLAVELGAPLAVAACAATLWVVARARPWAEVDPVRQMAWAVLAVIALHSLVEYPLWYGPFQLAFGLCLGLLARPTRGQDAISLARPWAQLLAAIVGATCIYAAWDYWRVSQIYMPPEVRAKGYREDPLSRMRDSRLFSHQVRFAELTTTPLTTGNAAWTFDTALALLHYSPEPKVIEKVIDSGRVLGRGDEVLPHLVRFRAAFPQAYEAWAKAQRRQSAVEAP